MRILFGNEGGSGPAVMGYGALDVATRSALAARPGRALAEARYDGTRQLGGLLDRLARLAAAWRPASR